MDSVVQFVRNFLCCIKDLNLLSDTPLYDSNVTRSYVKPYYDLPDPLDQTTPLEAIISVSQFYAFASTSYGGYKLATSSYAKFHRVQRLMDVRGKEPAAFRSPADRLVNASLVEEANSAIRQMFVGLMILSLGTAFFWLFANSWHVTETPWLGGLPGLIHALTVMEIALLPLLYLMYADGTALLQRSKRLQAMASSEEGGGVVSEIVTKTIDLQTLRALSDWTPFWADGGFSGSGSKEDEKMIQVETERVRTVLADLVKTISKDKDEDGEKESKLRREELAEGLARKANVCAWEGYREYLYFLLNFVAFYGYLLPVLVFYFDAAGEQYHHHLVRQARLGLSDEDADWHGNFAGDLMWTIEPVVVLASPLLIRYWTEGMTGRTASHLQKRAKAE